VLLVDCFRWTFLNQFLKNFTSSISHSTKLYFNPLYHFFQVPPTSYLGKKKVGGGGMTKSFKGWLKLSPTKFSSDFFAPHQNFSSTFFTPTKTFPRLFFYPNQNFSRIFFSSNTKSYRFNQMNFSWTYLFVI